MSTKSKSNSKDSREFEFHDRDFRRVCDLIYQRVGITLGDSKRDMVYGRLSRRLRSLGLTNFKEYLDQLERQGGDEWQAFTNALTTNLTSFFREPHHFERLTEQLKQLKQKMSSQDIIHIWTCASSTGEEPYSIAITACEVFNSTNPPVHILATDVDTQVLSTASNAVYALDRISGMDENFKRKYFQRGTGPNQGMCRVIPSLRNLLEFRQLNLLDPHYNVGGPFSAIFCRNVMIYFDKPTQHDIVSKLTLAMDDNSLLYTGHSENYLHAADLITPCGRTVYRRTTK